MTIAIFLLAWVAISIAIGLIYGLLNWLRADRNAGQWTVEMWAEHYEIPLDVARGTIPSEYLQ